MHYAILDPQKNYQNVGTLESGSSEAELRAAATSAGWDIEDADYALVEPINYVTFTVAEQHVLVLARIN